MDDLTKISGIGPATAKKLAGAGIDTYAKLAAANHEQLEALRISGNAEEHQALIRAAAELAPKTIDLTNASADEIAAQAAKIETARVQLAQRADTAVMAFGLLKAAQGASEADFLAAETTFNDAISAVHAAVAEARALLGVPEDAPLPPALVEELSQLQALPPFVPSIVRTATEASSATAGFNAEGESTRKDADTVEQLREQPANAPMFTAQDEAHAFLTDVISRARAAAAAGEIAEAGEFLREHRTELRAGQALLAEMLAGVEAEIQALDLIQTTAPVEHGVEVVAKVESRWRIGRQFGKAATSFEPGELAANELEALRADPLLVVTEVR